MTKINVAKIKVTDIKVTDIKVTRVKGWIISTVVALPITFGLFFAMTTLIAPNKQQLLNPAVNSVQDIHMIERALEVQYKKNKPEKIQTLTQPALASPPLLRDQINHELDQQALQLPHSNFKTDFDFARLDANAVGAQPTGLASGALTADGEFLPILKIQPRYPSRALQRGIEGYVVVEFTVTKLGTVKNIIVVEAQPKHTFNREAIKAVEKFKYKPRVENGEPIEVTGVRNKFTFQLE